MKRRDTQPVQTVHRSTISYYITGACASGAPSARPRRRFHNHHAVFTFSLSRPRADDKQTNILAVTAKLTTQHNKPKQPTLRTTIMSPNIIPAKLKLPQHNKVCYDKTDEAHRSSTCKTERLLFNISAEYLDSYSLIINAYLN